MEQYGDLSKMTLEEVIGPLLVQEQRLHDREARKEQQALLARAMGKTKLNIGYDHPIRGCGPSRGRGRGQGR